MKNAIIISTFAVISVAAASRSEARFKRPAPVANTVQLATTPEERLCGEILECLMAEPCYVEDEHGTVREVTKEEKEVLKDWMDENCTYVAAPDTEDATCPLQDAATLDSSDLQVGG